LERKWSQLEQVNYDLKTFIQAKKTETNYEDVKSVAMSLLEELNAYLQNSVTVM
jgi:hypothetical protein